MIHLVDNAFNNTRFDNLTGFYIQSRSEISNID